MKSRCLLTIVATGMLGTVSVGAEPAFTVLLEKRSKFVSLFDGKSLTGWEAVPTKTAAD